MYLSQLDSFSSFLVFNLILPGRADSSRGYFIHGVRVPQNMVRRKCCKKNKCPFQTLGFLFQLSGGFLIALLSFLIQHI